MVLAIGAVAGAYLLTSGSEQQALGEATSNDRPVLTDNPEPVEMPPVECPAEGQSGTTFVDPVAGAWTIELPSEMTYLSDKSFGIEATGVAATGGYDTCAVSYAAVVAESESDLIAMVDGNLGGLVRSLESQLGDTVEVPSPKVKAVTVMGGPGVAFGTGGTAGGDVLSYSRVLFSRDGLEFLVVGIDRMADDSDTARSVSELISPG